MVNFPNPDGSYLRHLFPQEAQLMDEALIDFEFKNLDFKFKKVKYKNQTKYTITLTNDLLLQIAPVDRGMCGTYEWFSFVASQNQKNGLKRIVRASIKISETNILEDKHKILFSYTLQAASIRELLIQSLHGLDHFCGIKAFPIPLNKKKKIIQR